MFSDHSLDRASRQEAASQLQEVGMGRASFDFDVISGPVPARPQTPQPAPDKPASGGAGGSGAAPPSDAQANAK